MNGLKINSKVAVLVVLLSALYLIFTQIFEGLKAEHWFIVVFYNLCFFISPVTRKFILAFTIFIFFGIFYDLMKAYPNYMVNPVDIAPLYQFDIQLFGVNNGGKIISINQYFFQHHSVFLDVVSGLFYINWVPVPLAFAFYLYMTNKAQYLQFSLTFLIVNIIGFCIYYIHPAAPPWYVELYGFDKHLGVKGFAAGLSRLDHLIHVPVFQSIYLKNSNIFAALPSLHSSYPLIVLFYSIRNKMKLMSIFAVIFTLGIWFAAVYTGHHYLTDVILGILCAVVGILAFRKIFLRSERISGWIEKYRIAIT